MADTLFTFPNLTKTLTDYAVAVRNLYQDNLIKSDHLASGRLLNSVEYVTDFGDNEFVVSLRLEDYWKYLENGTPPHFPPVDAILSWIRVKPVLPKPYYKKWKWTTVDGATHENGKWVLPTPVEQAWMTAKKIEREGTEGTKDLELTLETVNSEYEKRIMDALNSDLSNIIDATLWMLITT